MKNIFFDSIVSALLMQKNKLISIATVRQIFSRIMGDLYSDKKMYKLLYYLKNRGYLITMKKNIYFVKHSDDVYTDQWFVDRFYRDLLKKHCKEYLDSDWYIGGLKALELHLALLDIPDEIVVSNMTKQATEVVLFDKKVLFKTSFSGKKNLFAFYKKHIHKISVGRNLRVPVICMEIALLETLYNPSVVHKGYIDTLIQKMLKKYKHTLDSSLWIQVIRNNKHHSSLNRLYTLALGVDKKFAEVIGNIIKKYSYNIDVR